MEKFGDLATIAFSEPAWYGNPSPYYTDDHRAWRAHCRKFMEEEIMPYRDEWDNEGKFPPELFLKAGKAGILAAAVGWPEDLAPGPRPKGYDTFFSVIAMDELSRVGSGGIVWGLIGGLGIGSHPIIHSENKELRDKVMQPALRGEVKICLAVSEAQAGSDVANLTTTAKDDGDFLVINGNKKWITGGMFADYMTTAVKLEDGSKGFAAIRLVLIPAKTPGVSTRLIPCMGAQGSGTAFIEFDDVRVPKANILGDASMLMRNFVGERLGLATQSNRFARVCYTETVMWTRRRKAFGKLLTEQPIVRYKLAQMMQKIESTQAMIEALVYRISVMEKEGGDDWFDGILKLGAEASLVKVLASETFEFCAREAALINGGNSYIRGNRIEHLYRQVISMLVPGGSVDVLLDNSAKLALQGKL